MAPRHPGSPCPPRRRPVWSSPASSTVRCTATVDASRRRRLWPRRSRACRMRRRWPGSGSTARPRLNCTLRQSNSICTSSRSRMRSSRTSVRSSSATARRCSWCSALPATSTSRRRSTSVNCTSSAVPPSCSPVRHSESPDLSNVRDRMESDPELLKLGPEPVLYAILDAVVDGYAPVVADCRTTSTRSRPRCSAAIRWCRVASTNSRASGRVPARHEAAAGHAAGAVRRFRQVPDRRGTAEVSARRHRSRDHGRRTGDGFRNCSAASSRSTRRWSRSAEREMRNLTQASYAQNEDQEGLVLGGDPVSRPLSSEPSTA